jgi:hypothetical protein
MDGLYLPEMAAMTSHRNLAARRPRQVRDFEQEQAHGIPAVVFRL